MGLTLILLCLGIFLVVLGICVWFGVFGTAMISLSAYIVLGGLGVMVVASVVGVVQLFLS